MKRFLLLLFVITFALCNSGCITAMQGDGKLRHSSFEVDISELDWLEILYTPAENDREILLPCRLSFFGVCHVDFKTGKSPKFWKETSTDTANPDWGSYYTDRVTIGREEMERVFQAFVDEGVVPPPYMLVSRDVVSSEANARVSIKGIIGFKEFRLTTDNKYIVGVTEEALENFEATIAIARENELRKARE
ncbi:MAG: hypothetical protein IJ444_00450 [Kiritimatiellae bacterium]|nr:hypothetical protein [Kiritimatiellia bacterium]